MAAIHITDIESAINWWRERSPSPDGITACAQVRALATVYGLMVYYHETECDEATMPATTSTTMKAAMIARAMPSHRRSASADGVWWW